MLSISGRIVDIIVANPAAYRHDKNKEYVTDTMTSIGMTKRGQHDKEGGQHYKHMGTM